MIATRSITFASDPFVNNVTEVGFTVIPQFKDIRGNVPRFKAIQVLNVDLLAKFNGQTLCSAADLVTLTIQIRDRNDDTKFEDIPLTAMLRGSNGGFYYEIDNLDIDFASTKIILQNGNRTAGQVVAFEGIYDYFTN